MRLALAIYLSLVAAALHSAASTIGCAASRIAKGAR